VCRPAAVFFIDFLFSSAPSAGAAGPGRVPDPVATGFPALAACEDAMRRNLSTLKEALSAR